MKRYKLLIVIAMGLLFLQPAVAQKRTSWQSLQQDFLLAKDLFEKEKYVSAQEKFDLLRAKAKGGTSQLEGEAAYYAAVCSNNLNNDDAETRLKSFLALYPQSGRTNMARLQLANFYYRRGHYDKALAYYRQVDKVGVEYGYRSEFDFKMAYCYFEGGNSKQAKPMFAQLASGQSKYRNAATYYYAHIQYADGEYDQSLRNFQQIANDKNFVKVVPSYVARLYYYLGRYDELLDMAPALLADANTFKADEIRQMVAEVYYNRGEYAEALKYYRVVEQIAPAEAESDPLGNARYNKNAKKNDPAKQVCTPQDNYYQMGYCYYMMHQYDSAANYLAKKSVCDDSVAQNALYTLGDIYIKQGRKDEARSMFLQASKMSYNAKIEEDALFNYAKLSCELGKNPYNESIRSFQDYLKRYPQTKYKGEIQEILASLYLSTRNYKDALSLIEKIPDRSVAMNRAYQRIVLNRGIEIFNTGDEASAIDYFKKAVRLNVDPKITADANYLLGESSYRVGDYATAQRSLDRFLLSSNAKKSSYYAQGLYTQGYLYMKNQHYGEAEDCFKKYVECQSTKLDNHQAYDVFNRLGDCRYVQSAFSESIPYYDRVINAKDKDADYATYQKAMAYGAMGRVSDKLNNLNYIFEKYDNSPLASKAQLEIANTYLVCDNSENALLYYNNFVKRYPNSAYVKDALLSMGIIYYNDSRYDEALNTFDQLLNQYPGTTESRDALSTVKDIYVKQNRVDEYFAYVKRTTKVTVSSVEQDSTTYTAAEDRYMEGDYSQAITGLENYLNRFPNGLFALQAHYYAADAHFRLGHNNEALPHYVAVASAAKNQYTESSLYNGANIAYNQGDYDRALSLYQKLVATAETDASRLQGRVGAMRCQVRLGATQATIDAANALLAERKISTAEHDEALLAKARIFYAQQRFDSAAVCYIPLRSSSNGEYAGEALYYKAERLFVLEQQNGSRTGKSAKRFQQAEETIEAIVANPTSDYWLAKSFILWADIYYARGNNLQAKQTLQSIIDNYDGADLVQLATSKRDAIIAAETPEAPVEEEPYIIPID